MQYVDNEIADLKKSQKFTDTTNINDRAQLAIDLLTELSDEGKVKRNSITYEENSDNIGFQYSTGALGGLMLKDWNDRIDESGQINHITDPNLYTN